MSINVSKQKREDLLKKIDKIREYIEAAKQDENTARLLSYLEEIRQDVDRKKYGIVFEEHSEETDAMLNTHTPILTEKRDLFVDRGGVMNFLIEGDNLAALKLLEKTHGGGIDIIYIDPPYNTGNRDFIYDDNYVAPEDTFKHSKWLSFMEKRLRKAYNLLAESGVIYISIDDNEMMPLKLLCDEIFKPYNFVASLPRLTKKSGKDHTEDIAKNHDYVLVYVKNREQAQFKGIESEEDGYPLRDEYYAERGGYKLNQTLDYDSLWYNPGMDFELNIDGIKFYPGGDKEMHARRHGGEHKAKDWVWRWSREKFDFGYKNGFIVIKQGRDGRPRIYTKTYFNATISKSRPYKIEYKNRETHLSSIALTDNRFSNDNAKKEITRIGLEKFDFPKSSTLIEQLIRITKKSDTVLDFFAGSGTTGHAVMKLNAEDGGGRRFILCTNNENNICRDVTYERIKRVIENEKYSASLKYYNVDYLPVDEYMYYEYADKLLGHVRELIEIENGVNFADGGELAFVLSDEEMEDFCGDDAAMDKCRKIYVGHEVLPSAEQEAKIAARGIAMNIVPDYYYGELEQE